MEEGAPTLLGEEASRSVIIDDMIKPQTLLCQVQSPMEKAKNAT